MRKLRIAVDFIQLGALDRHVVFTDENPLGCFCLESDTESQKEHKANGSDDHHVSSVPSLFVEIVVLPDDVGWLQGFVHFRVNSTKLDLWHRGKIVVGLFGLHRHECSDGVTDALLVLLLVKYACFLILGILDVLLDPASKFLIQDVELLPLLPFDVVTLFSQHVQDP